MCVRECVSACACACVSVCVRLSACVCALCATVIHQSVCVCSVLAAGMLVLRDNVFNHLPPSTRLNLAALGKSCEKVSASIDKQINSDREGRLLGHRSRLQTRACRHEL